MTADGTIDEEFVAERFARSHTLRFDAPIDRVFELFTPEGERRWVPGWNPRYWPDHGGALAPGMVFTTDAGEEHTVWVVARFDPSAYEADYARLVPESRVGLVRLRCSAAPSGAGTDVTVTYLLTGLSRDGNARLRALADGGHAAMMQRWEVDVARALAHRS